MIAALALAAGLATTFPVPQAREEGQAASSERSALQREWAVRSMALDPMRHTGDIQRMLGSAEWTEVYDALDALARSARGARYASESVELEGYLSHAHSSVRAAAWRLLLSTDAAAPASSGAVSPAGTVSAAEMHGWSAWTALGVGAGQGGWTAERAGALGAWLAGSAEAFAGTTSHAGLLEPADALSTLGPGAGAVQAAWLAPGGVLDPQRLERFLGPWLRHPSGDPLVTAMGAVELPAGMDELERRVHGGLLAGFGLALGEAERIDAYLGAIPPGAHLGRGGRASRTRAKRETFVDGVARRAGGAAGHLLRDLALTIEDDPERRELVLEAAARALPPGRALPLALGLEAADARVLWRSAGGAERIELGLLVPWISADIDPELRMAAAREIARGLAGPEAERSNELLLGLVLDADSALAEASFRWLAAAAGEGGIEWDGLFGAWGQLPRDRRIELLEHLPRSKPMPHFWPFALELIEDPATRKPAHIELLKGAQPSSAVNGTLNRVFGEEFQTCLDSGAPKKVYRKGERLAYACLQAMGRGGRDAELLAADLQRLRMFLVENPGRAESVAERLVAMLARTPRGRAELAWGRVQTLSSRLRIEAFLQLAAAQARGAEDAPELLGPFVEERLSDAYTNCDEPLRQRLLAALADLRLGSRSLLVGQAVGSSVAELLAEAALTSLVARADWEPVEEVLLGRGTPERRLAAVRAVGAAPRGPDWDEPAVDLLRRGLATAGAPGAGARPGEGPGREFELALLSQLLQREAFGDEDVQRLWAGPFSSAPPDLAQRQAGTGRAAAGFRWRGELELIEGLAARGLLSAALGACPEPWRLDGQFLSAAALAADAGRAGAGAALADLALVALAGEAPTPAGALAQVRARGLAFDGAIAADDHVAAAFHADRMALRLRVGGAPGREIVRRGSFPGAFEAHRFAQSERLAARARRARATGNDAAADRFAALAQDAR